MTAYFERVKGACKTHILSVFTHYYPYNVQMLVSGGPPGRPPSTLGAGPHHGLRSAPLAGSLSITLAMVSRSSPSLVIVVCLCWHHSYGHQQGYY